MFDGKIIIKIPKCVASNRPMLHPVTALGIPWHPLASLGIPWDPLGSLGIPWDPLGHRTRWTAHRATGCASWRKSPAIGWASPVVNFDPQK
jgi:hypothetical protein